jgi:hypothetical protein
MKPVESKPNWLDIQMNIAGVIVKDIKPCIVYTSEDGFLDISEILKTLKQKYTPNNAQEIVLTCNKLIDFADRNHIKINYGIGYYSISIEYPPLDHNKLIEIIECIRLIPHPIYLKYQELKAP